MIYKQYGKTGKRVSAVGFGGMRFDTSLPNEENAPQNLENELKADPLISQVMVHGDQRKFTTALVTLNEESARKWAADNGVPAGAKLHEDPRVYGRIHRTVDTPNSKQASYSAIKKFAIFPGDFSIETGELTPTLKVKRKFCAQKYKDVLDAFYVE